MANVPGSPQRKSALKKSDSVKSPETKKARVEGDEVVLGASAASVLPGLGSVGFGGAPGGGLRGEGSGVGAVPPFPFVATAAGLGGGSREFADSPRKNSFPCGACYKMSCEHCCVLECVKQAAAAARRVDGEGLSMQDLMDEIKSNRG